MPGELRTMTQIHLRAEVGDYAPLVLLPGDPNRATRIAELFDDGLQGSRLVNDHRGMLGYTGTYKGKPVSVQTSGMGTPSISIIIEELLNLGARRLVRVGTTGGIGRGVRAADLVIATAAAPVDGATATYLHGDAYAPAADFELTRALVDAARAKGVEPHIGQVATVDVFYNPDEDYVTKWRARNILGFEMEAAALFYLAARAAGAGEDVRAACILTVSDTLSEEESSEDTYLPLDALEKATDRMIEVALEAGLSI
jgi:purine-nucleoside phosphorylase